MPPWLFYGLHFQLSLSVIITLTFKGIFLGQSFYCSIGSPLGHIRKILSFQKVNLQSCNYLNESIDLF